MAELTVMLVGFFWLFELGKWETYLIVFLNFAVLIGVNYILDNYWQSSRDGGINPECTTDANREVT